MSRNYQHTITGRTYDLFSTGKRTHPPPARDRRRPQRVLDKGNLRRLPTFLSTNADLIRYTAPSGAYVPMNVALISLPKPSRATAKPSRRL
jgi:hypothetical protein